MVSEIEDLIETLDLGGMRGPIDMMMSRERDFPSPLAAMLSGVGVQEEARRHMDALSSQVWGREWRVPTDPITEVVVGAGPHALIYAAVRASKGVKVVLLEKSNRAGGSFACSDGPSFWLNSRNRPGPLGLPGDGVGLNVLPGCALQPSMTGGGEYQSNDLLAWVIRMNLMMLPNVEVHTGVKVKSISEDQGTYELGLGGSTNRNSVLAKRVIFATGLGNPEPFNNPNDPGNKSDRLLTFSEFMAKMDSVFPLQGMGRVAVVGAGDSGKTAIEALLGQGPSTGLSVAALDFPDRIDWYGCPHPTQADWCANNRGRYNRIGKALGTRIIPLPRASLYPTPGYKSVQIGPKGYDLVINCLGYTGLVKVTRDCARTDYGIGDRVLAQRLMVRSESKPEAYEIGPAARISVARSDREIAPVLTSIPDNATSIFRYAPLTAAFAANLPVPAVSVD